MFSTKNLFLPKGTFISRLVCLSLFLLISIPIYAQERESIPHFDGNLKFSLNNDGSQWIAFHTYGQFWGRFNENNPGSLLSEEIQQNTYDVSIRRFRLGIQSQVTERLFTYLQFGINNLNYLSPRGTSLDILDAYAEYSFSNALEVGGGKTAWTGLSRYSAPNTSKLLTYDLVQLALPTTDETDDLIRKLSVYTKGQVGRLDYRYILSKPFSANNSLAFDGELLENIAKFNGRTDNAIHSAYVKWQFIDLESNKIPFSDGTYLGAKTIFNIGIGGEYRNDGLSSLQNGIETNHDIRLFAVDAFLDIPVNPAKNTVFTSYLGYFDYDFGPNYLRNAGVNNPVLEVDSQLASFNGAGNAFPKVGTGRSWSLQAGYLLPYFKDRKFGQVQPYASLQYSNFERLDDAMVNYHIGINWLLKGHLSKFSLNYQNRPIFNTVNGSLQQTDSRATIILQYILRLE